MQHQPCESCGQRDALTASPFHLSVLTACRATLLLHRCQTSTLRLPRSTLCRGVAGCGPGRGRAMLDGLAAWPWSSGPQWQCWQAQPEHPCVHRRAASLQGPHGGMLWSRPPAKTLLVMTACRRILQSAPESGLHLTVIRRYNPISNKGRASDTLEKQVPAVFQSNEGNKYRKDYIK